MEKDARNEAVIADLGALVPQDYFLRKIEKLMDYDWLYERLDLHCATRIDDREQTRSFS